MPAALAIRFQQSSLPSLYRIPFSRMSADILEPVSAGFDLNTAFGEQHRPVPHICMHGLSNLHNPPTTFLQICVQTLSRIQRLMTRVMLVTTSTFASNRCVRFSRSALSTISADCEFCMAPSPFHIQMHHAEERQEVFDNSPGTSPSRSALSPFGVREAMLAHSILRFAGS